VVYRFVWILILGLSLSTGHANEAGSEYLGNEGVMVSHGKWKVLFDTFYLDGMNLYALVAPQTRAQLMAGERPYDGVDAIFVSHIHDDHFNASETLAYLRSQPDVSLFAPKQVVDALSQSINSDDPLTERMVGFELRPGDAAQSISRGGILVEAVNIPHAGGERMAQISNLAFRVTLGKWPTVLHLGDAGVDGAYFESLQPHWDARLTDIAFPPYWFFLQEEGHKVLSQKIQALQTIGIHVPASAAGNGASWRQKARGDLYTDPGERRNIPYRNKKTP